MAQENKETKVENKEIKHEHHEHKVENKETKPFAEASEKVKSDVNAGSQPQAPSSDNKEIKTEEKKDKKPKVEKPKKIEAIAKGTNLHASKKHCMYICSFIKNKPIDLAIRQLQEVTVYKRLIPFKGEIPHKHSTEMMIGRYPINASKEIIYVLKALKGNVLSNGLDLDKTRVYFASATWASRPARRGGSRFKRAFVLLKAKEFNTQKAEAKK